jgi:hypothetical protein
MDNAENNAVAMRELQELFEKEDIKFDHKDNRIGCYPHIINICVSHIVSSLTEVDAGDLDTDDSSDDESDDGGYVGGYAGDTEREVIDSRQINTAELKRWFENVKRDPVKRARAVVRTVRSSGQRKEAFLALIKSGNQTGMFRDEEGKPMKIKELQLLKDVKHRWDSLYLMLSRLQELRQVFPCISLSLWL